MICPHCGYDMENRSRCLRCGYQVKTLAVVDESEEDNSQGESEEKIETKVIDPCNVYLTHPYGVEDDDDYDPIFGGGGFGSIFDMLFGDPISDLLGGLFGMGTSSRRSSRAQQQQEEQPKKKRKQGPIVDVAADEVELYDANGNQVKPKSTTAQEKPNQSNAGASGQRPKNTFRRGNRKK